MIQWPSSRGRIFLNSVFPDEFLTSGEKYNNCQPAKRGTEPLPPGSVLRSAVFIRILATGPRSRQQERSEDCHTCALTTNPSVLSPPLYRSPQIFFPPPLQLRLGGCGLFAFRPSVVLIQRHPSPPIQSSPRTSQLPDS